MREAGRRGEVAFDGGLLDGWRGLRQEGDYSGDLGFWGEGILGLGLASRAI